MATLLEESSTQSIRHDGQCVQKL